MVFFDIDGTLLDDASAIRGGLDSLHQSYGYAIAHSSHELPSVWQQLIDVHYPRYLRGELTMEEQRRQRVRALLRQDAGPVSNGAVDEIFATYLRGYEAGWQCFDDVLPVLQAMQPGRLGVITNGDQTQQTRKLAATGLLPFFEIVVSSSELGVAKPDRAIFLEACARAGMDVASCTYVGDSWETDVLGSQQAGLRPVWLRRSTFCGSHRETNVPIVRSLTELLVLEGFSL